MMAAMDIGSLLMRGVAVVAHLVMLPIFIVQGLNVPTEGVLFLVGLWLVLSATIVIAWRRSAALVALVPVADIALVYGVTAIGRALFGWQG